MAYVIFWFKSVPLTALLNFVLSSSNICIRPEIPVHLFVVIIGYEFPNPSLKWSTKVKVEHAAPLILLLKGATNIRAIKLKIMTNRLKIVEIIKNITLHAVEELDSELKQQYENYLYNTTN